MSETDEEFLDRIADYLDDYSGIPKEVRVRLFALARRGADAAAEIERLRAALRDIADGLGETDLAEVGRYAKHIARAALKEDGDE